MKPVSMSDLSDDALIFAWAYVIAKAGLQVREELSSYRKSKERHQ